MIIFLYGEDTYRSRQKLDEIIAHYKETPKSGLNLKFFDGKKLNLQDIKDELQTISMFKEKKLFILSDIFGNQEFKDGFVKAVEKFLGSENTVLFYEERGDLAKDAFFTFLKKKAKSQEFAPLSGQKLRVWLKGEFEKLKVRVDPMVPESMIGFVGNDLWQLSNEVRKLTTFAGGKEIKIADVTLLIKPKIETDIFKTIDAIALKNKKQALNLLHRHLEKGENPLYLLSMINYQFRNVLGVKDLTERGKTLSRSGLKPFVARKSYEQSRKFTLEELKKIYQKIFQADYNIKTGRLDAQAALDLLIAEL